MFMLQQDQFKMELSWTLLLWCGLLCTLVCSGASINTTAETIPQTSTSSSNIDNGVTANTTNGSTVISTTTTTTRPTLALNTTTSQPLPTTTTSPATSNVMSSTLTMPMTSTSDVTTPQVINQVPQNVLAWIIRTNIYGLLPHSDIRSNNIQVGSEANAIERGLKFVVGTLFSQFWAMNFNYRNNKIYYTDFAFRHVAVYDFKDKTHKTVLTDMSFGVDGIAVDWVTGNVYMADTDKQWIIVSESTFTNYAILHRISSKIPAKIAVDPVGRMLYWSEIAENSCSIWRSDLAGNNKMTLHTFTGITLIHGLEFDANERRIYWSETERGTLMGYVKYFSVSNHTDMRTVYSESSAAFFGIASYKNLLYLSDNVKNQLVVVNKQTMVVERRVRLRGNEQPRSIIAFSADNQPIPSTLTNPCASRNCSQICLPMDNSLSRCACALGNTLAADGVTCSNGHVTGDFLLAYDEPHQKIFQIQLSDPTIFATIPTSDPGLIFSVSYDHFTRMVYYSNIEKQIISRSQLDGSNYEIFMRGVKAYSIAIDETSRNLYYADANVDSMAVASLDLPNVSKTLHLNNIFKTFELYVDVTLEKMFWSDWGGKSIDGSDVGRIECAKLDGSGRMMLVESSEEPHALTVDSANQIVYWTELMQGNIAWFDLKTNRTGKYNVGFPKHQREKNNQLSGIAFHNQTLYVTDLRLSSVYSVTARDVMDDVSPSTAVTKFGPDSFFQLTGVHAYSALTHAPTKCGSSNRGGCPQVCLPKPMHTFPTHMCVCADHYKQENGTCVRQYTKDEIPPSFNGTCPSDQRSYTGQCGEKFVFNLAKPTPTDNSGTVKLRSSVHEDPPYHLGAGDHFFRYVAEDLSGNVMTCEFTVVVITTTCGLFPSGRLSTPSCKNLYGSNVSELCHDGSMIEYQCSFDGVWERQSGSGCPPPPDPTHPPQHTTDHSSHAATQPQPIGSTQYTTTTGNGQKPTSAFPHKTPRPNTHTSETAGDPHSGNPGTRGGIIALVILLVLAGLGVLGFFCYRYKHRLAAATHVVWSRGDDQVHLTNKEDSNDGWPTTASNIYTTT